MFLKGAFNYSVCRKHQTLVPIICASFAASKSMADQQGSVRVGILGTGWGVRVQVPQFRAAGLDVTALYSRDPQRAAALAEQHKLKGFSDDHALINSTDVDLVSIVTPPYLHRTQFKAALQAGKHVLVDKPMALNASEAEDMLQAASAVAASDPQRVVMVDHEMRFAPAFRRARELVHSGALGTLGLCSVNVMVPPLNKQYNWWADASKGGGVLRALGSHVIDLMRFLTMGEVTSVSAHMQCTNIHLPDEHGAAVQVTADDMCSARMVLTPGSRTPPNSPWWGNNPDVQQALPVTMLLSAWGAPGGQGPPFLLIGSKGSLLLDSTTGSCQHWVPGEDGKPQLQEEVKGAGSVFAVEGTMGLGRALQAALGGPEKHLEELRAYAASIEDGVATVYVMDAIMESSAAGGAPVTPKQL